MKISPMQNIRQMVARLNAIHKKYPGIVEAVGSIQGRAGFSDVAAKYACPHDTVLRVENILWQVQWHIGRSKTATAAFVRSHRD